MFTLVDDLETVRGSGVMQTDDPVIHSVYGRPIEILLVEDNEDDASLTVETLAQGRVRNPVTVVEDGVDAITFLRREGQFATVSRPDLILLDLKLPRKGGREVLTEIKQDPDLKRIPVVILSTSDAEKGIEESYSVHANCYVTKPFDLWVWNAVWEWWRVKGRQNAR